MSLTRVRVTSITQRI